MPAYFSGRDLYEARKDRHFTAIMLALGLSVVVHLVLVMTFSDWQFDAVRVSAAVEPENIRPPMRVERIPFDPQRALGNPATGDPNEGAGVGVPREQVHELARLPDPALMTPPAKSLDTLAGTLVNLQAPPRQPTALGWTPRQQIVAIVDQVVKDDLAALPRRSIPKIERVAQAPDYVPAVDVTRDRFGGEVELRAVAPATAPEPRAETVAVRETVDEAEVISTDEVATPEAAISRFGEQPGDVTDYFAIDSRLMAHLETYAPDGAAGRSYFRLLVTRRGETELPVVPKDIIFLQDSSRSLAEERLYFCRQALKSLLEKLGPDDRFNVVKFSGSAEFCFAEWAPVRPATLTQATAFIDTMRSEGATDIFASVRTLQTLPRDPARPLIAVVITDGQATTGLTESTKIIGQFSALNDGNCSVFALGTHGRANAYLLDLLSFCNRGSSVIVTTGRWDIPKKIEELVTGISRPVLGNIGVTADWTSKADLQPLPSANLFADRPLEYYGSTPPGVTNLVIQIRGEGGAAKCDVVFQLDLNAAPAGGESLRTGWARRKMHSLIGAYARDPQAEILREMRQLSRQYNLPIPYRGEL